LLVTGPVAAICKDEDFTEGPPVFFSHTDVVWSTSHEHSRLGMGALRASLEAVDGGLSMAHESFRHFCRSRVANA
jgi:hypothetical protein